MTQDKYRQAQDLTRSVKHMLKEGKVTAAVTTFQKGILLYIEISSKLLKGEQSDFQKIIETSLYQLNFDKKLRKARPSGLKYQRGKETALANELAQMVRQIDDYKTMEKRKRSAMVENKKKEVIDKGSDFIKSKQVKKAYILFRKAAKEFEKHTDFVVHLGKLLAQADRIEDAVEILKFVEKQKADDLNFLNTMATMLRKIQRYDKAAYYYNLALEQAPENEALLYNAARNYIEWRKFENAYDLLRKAVEINPDFTVGKKALKAVEKKIFVNNPKKKKASLK